MKKAVAYFSCRHREGKGRERPRQQEQGQDRARHGEGRRARHRQEHRRRRTALYNYDVVWTGVMVARRPRLLETARAEQADAIGPQGSSRRSRCDEMVHVAKKWSGQGILSAVAHLARDHVQGSHAMKIAEHYHGATVHVLDGVPLRGRGWQPPSDRARRCLRERHQGDYAKVKESTAQRRAAQDVAALDDARPDRFSSHWKAMPASGPSGGCARVRGLSRCGAGCPTSTGHRSLRRGAQGPLPQDSGRRPR